MSFQEPPPAGRRAGDESETRPAEAPVGPYSLDLLAKEVDKDVNVAIENQLECTDHDHLGKLLTYAAGRHAHIAIWVASEFAYEHAQALHLLNEWTSESISFYGVKIEAVKKAGDERPSRGSSRWCTPAAGTRNSHCHQGRCPSASADTTTSSSLSSRS